MTYHDHTTHVQQATQRRRLRCRELIAETAQLTRSYERQLVLVFVRPSGARATIARSTEVNGIFTTAEQIRDAPQLFGDLTPDAAPHVNKLAITFLLAEQSDLAVQLNCSDCHPPTNVQKDQEVSS